jgi:UDP:flavonoid glycosyltransferase YjiC (YdhE family)
MTDTQPRIILCTAGSHGDIHPFIAVALALKVRGAQPVISTNPYFQHEIESEGLRFHASGELVDVADFIRQNPWMHKPLVAGPKLFRDVVLPRVPEAQARLQAIIHEFKPHAVIVHPLCLGASAVCDQHRIPWMSMPLSPVLWMSRHEPCCTVPIGPGKHNPPLWWWRFVRFMGTRTMRSLIQRPLNADRAARNLPPIQNHWENVTRGGARSLGLWAQAFRAPMPDDPTQAAICGFPFYDQANKTWPQRDELERFLNAGPPPILFSLGTATVHDPGRFYEHAAKAATALNQRAVLLVGRGSTAPQQNQPNSSPQPSLSGPEGWQPVAGGEASPQRGRAEPPVNRNSTSSPEGATHTQTNDSTQSQTKAIITIPYAPFSQLMPRCAINVHHGGIGSTAQGLRAGKPTLIVPHSHDQFDNAARCERLGTSLTLPANRLNAARLTTALRTILDSPQMKSRAATLAPAMAHDGAASAAQTILESIALR